MTRRAATAEEARALAHPLRLRILRLCLDQARTNKQLADRLGENPATVLHHVRTLERTGFLAAEEPRAGPRGSRERPYRATGKSWTLDVRESGAVSSSSMLLAVVDAFRAEVLESPPDGIVHNTRMALRLLPEDREELQRRVTAIVEEFMEREDPAGQALGLFWALHQRGDGG
jgi:predicted ArsR family transcriptional regulator